MFEKLKNRLTQDLAHYRHGRLVSRGGLRQADAIPTHLNPAEKFMLYKLASQNSGVFVEVGSYLGASACFIAQGIQDGDGSDNILYCVDTWQNDAMSEGQKDTFSLFLENTRPYSQSISSLRGNSIDAASTFEAKVDFLFIDGDHSYVGVKADVEAWFPRLSKSPLVVFHDIGWAEGVQRIVQEHVAGRAKKQGRLPNLYWAWL